MNTSILIESLISGYNVLFEGEQEFDRFELADEIYNKIIRKLNTNDVTIHSDPEKYKEYCQIISDIESGKIPTDITHETLRGYNNGKFPSITIELDYDTLKTVELYSTCNLKYVTPNGKISKFTTYGQYSSYGKGISLISPTEINTANDAIKYMLSYYHIIIHEIIHAIDAAELKYPRSQSRKSPSSNGSAKRELGNKILKSIADSNRASTQKERSELINKTIELRIKYRKKFGENFDVLKYEDKTNYYNRTTEMSGHLGTLIGLIAPYRTPDSMRNLRNLSIHGPYSNLLPEPFRVLLDEYTKLQFKSNKKAFLKRLIYIAKRRYEKFLTLYANEAIAKKSSDERLSTFFNNDDVINDLKKKRDEILSISTQV